MSELEREVAREQAHVDLALARLEVLRADALRREQESLRPVGGSPQAVYERDVTALAAAARRGDLDAAGEGLVFGRLDVADGAPLHIGRLGMRTCEQEPIVVDWRAPAAAPFYRATAADPLGVVRRRTISCRGSRVNGVEDELLDPSASLDGTVVVGDGAFLAAVSRERGPQMRDIVATIQREQDLAVRAPDDGALVVTGGPGTGKTAVALHRVAYLMYAKREWYGRRGVLVVGPSPVFVDYIGAVLPSLGETSVRLSDLGGLPVLPRGLTVNGYDTPAVVALKGSARMAQLLARVVRHLATAARVPDLELTRWGHTFVVPARELVQRRQQITRSPRSHNAGHAAYAAALTEIAWRAWERRPAAARPEPGDREDFGAWLRAAPAFQRVLGLAWPVLVPEQVLAALQSGSVPLRSGSYSGDELRALSSSWPTTSLSASDTAIFDELAALLGTPPEPEPDPDEDWDELADLDARARATQVTTFADRNRSTRPSLLADADLRTYAHVVVDEAQDVTPMQWRMLGRRARGATWTVVGDWAQSAWPDVEEVRSALNDVLGRSRVRTVELTTNYRTSTEVAALAARVLARVDPAAVAPAAVRTSGVEPEWDVVPAPADAQDAVSAADAQDAVSAADAQDALLAALPEAVSALFAAVSGTVGIVCPHALLHPARAVLGVLDPRVSVVDTWQVKGLEYDGCVVLSPEQVVTESLTTQAGLRTLYVALTRATQRLTVLSTVSLEALLS